MRVAVCDPYRLVMLALAGAIRDAGHVVVSTDVTVRGLLASAAAHRPDVCLVDRGLAEDAGDLLGRLRSVAPRVGVVLLSGDRRGTAAPPAAGTLPVVTRDQPLADIVGALTGPHRTTRSPAPAGPPGRSGDRTPPAANSPARDPGWMLRFLTEREWQVLTLLAAGESTDRIGASLGVRTSTARAYVQRMLDKLGVHSRLEATSLLAAHRRRRTTGQ